jgi:hypothetical protein
MTAWVFFGLLFLMRIRLHYSIQISQGFQKANVVAKQLTLLEGPVKG